MSRRRHQDRAAGLKGIIRYDAIWTTTNGADEEILRVRFGGISECSYTRATVTAAAYYRPPTLHPEPRRHQLAGWRPLVDDGRLWIGQRRLDLDGRHRGADLAQKENAGDTTVLERHLDELILP